MINPELSIPKGKKLVVITGVSGAGKTAVASEIELRANSVVRCRTATTRPMRNGEENERDYFFYSTMEFEKILKLNPNFFFEYEEVYPGRFYGVPYCPLQKAWRNEKTPYIVIDPKGALKFQTAFPEQVMVVYLTLPDPIRENAKTRLLKREDMTPKDIQTRLFQIGSEIEIAENFKHHVVNHYNKLGQTSEHVSRIIS